MSEQNDNLKHMVLECQNKIYFISCYWTLFLLWLVSASKGIEIILSMKPEMEFCEKLYLH